MAKFRNQASLRAQVSRIGASTVVLCIILIAIFSNQNDSAPQSADEVLTPSELDIAAPKSENKIASTVVELEAVNQETTEVSPRNSAATESIAAPMKTNSMVQYGNMEALVEDNKGKVIWKTLGQRHIKSFEIQRSIDGKTFETVGVLEGEGTGEYMLEKLYEFVDSKLAMIQMPRVYYRIKQIGFDGVEDYSGTMEYDFDLNLGIYARIEDKSNGKIIILYAADRKGPITLSLLNVAGQVIETQNIEANMEPQLLAIDATHLKEGNYFLQLKNKATSIMEQFEYQK